MKEHFDTSIDHWSSKEEGEGGEESIEDVSDITTPSISRKSPGPPNSAGQSQVCLYEFKFIQGFNFFETGNEHRG